MQIRTAVFAATLVLAGLVTGVNTGRAQNAEAMQAARQLVDVLNKGTIRQMATQVTAQIWPQIETTLKAKQSFTEVELNNLRNEYERILVEFISKTMDDAPAIYARYFTASELHELLAFYRTPVGEKSLRVLPQITAETMALLMPRLQQLQATVLVTFTEILRQRGIK